MSSLSPPSSTSRMPVYFLGIGGPSFIEDTKHPAYTQLTKIGLEITTQVNPKAIVVFSAHWQDGARKASINASEHTDLIYDFNGFPAHYYEYDYPNRGSPEVAEKVIEKLSAVGIEAERVKRGLDHGVWAGFMVCYDEAFDPKKNPLTVPIVQVSLFNNEDYELHYRMGQALEGLRDEGILIIGAGMAAHNLRDYRAIRGSGKTMPYVSSFDNALKLAATANPDERQTAMSELMRCSDARQAHPTLDHILPIYPPKIVALQIASPSRNERRICDIEQATNMAPVIDVIRHAESIHNITRNVSLRDPNLTSEGESQAFQLGCSYAYMRRISHIVASPMTRTIRTAIIAFEEILAEGKRVILLPELQETGANPSNTGQPPEDLEETFQPYVDISVLDNKWFHKVPGSKYLPDVALVEARARQARIFLRELAQYGPDDAHIVVVSHGGFLHFLTEDYSGLSERYTTTYGNAMMRSFEFVDLYGDDDDAKMVETDESCRKWRLPRFIDMSQDEKERLRSYAVARVESQKRIFENMTRDASNLRSRLTPSTSA
ncbi:hypothetical protein NUW58_g8407 [Xylaria curta]|uniref:Uncharacterized protein n=1 Tax=Xylaria curta TaxID=42375 RepID=A0ACC1N7M7_9PEZI|nr:hypothetical protein NUW58_g8407 [Xylaria curta]